MRISSSSYGSRTPVSPPASTSRRPPQLSSWQVLGRGHPGGPKPARPPPAAASNRTSSRPRGSGSRTGRGRSRRRHRAASPVRACVANLRLRHRLIGYARVSKTDGSQSLDLQRDALGTARRRRGQRLARPRVRCPGRPAGLDRLPARPAEGRCAGRLEARPPRPEPRPPGQHRAGPVGPRRGTCGCSPPRARRSTPRPRAARPRRRPQAWCRRARGRVGKRLRAVREARRRQGRGPTAGERW